VIVLFAGAVVWWWFGRGTAAPQPPDLQAPEPASVTQDAQVLAPGLESESDVAAEPDADPVAELAPDPEPIDVPPAATTPASNVVESDMVAAAAVCEQFSPTGVNWQCNAIVSPVAGGRSLVFYTRVRTARALTVEHMWYQGEALHQRVELPIGANPGAGYRTYSRTTVTPGDWRVQLRVGGVVVYESTVAVR
jgi:hypothetical protein